VNGGGVSRHAQRGTDGRDRPAAFIEDAVTIPPAIVILMVPI
jgi:uncharacterized membrane protein